MSFNRGVQNAMLDFHVSTEVALQVELAGAVRTLEGLTSCMEVHVAQEVVHPVERLSTHLRRTKRTKVRRPDCCCGPLRPPGPLVNSGLGSPCI